MVYLSFDRFLEYTETRPFFHVAMENLWSEMGTRCVFCDKGPEFCNIHSIQSVLRRGKFIFAWRPV